MLKNIKSTFILRRCFSVLDESRKLKLLKYNRNLQKKININIINYKFYSGRYIIFYSYGKGKEYKGCNDILIYEGEFLIGERNGKGKEYSDILQFEGEYLNGKRNGRGKEYDYCGNLRFEGVYLDNINYLEKDSMNTVI